MAKKPKTANAEGALAKLKVMAEQPRQTPLEKFVFENFDAVATLHAQGYTVPDICTALKEEGYAASPPTLHGALNKAAGSLGKPNPFKRSPKEEDTPMNTNQSEVTPSVPPSVPASNPNGLQRAY